MALPFIATAISRLDGGNADGIHLLWTAPPAAGYSVRGYDIQRRIAKHKPEITCYTLTPSELEALHRDLRIDTSIARIGVCRSVCPEFPAEPPDEPAGGAPGLACIDFQKFRIGSGPNPRVEHDVSFRVLRPRTNQTTIRRSSVFTGLDIGVQLEITLPKPAHIVEVTLVHFERPPKVEAFNQDGSNAGIAVMTAGNGQAETLRFSGVGIVRLLVTSPDGDVLLLSLCMDEPSCVVFENAEADTGPNPRTQQRVVFTVRGPRGAPAPLQTQVRKDGNITGLDCGVELEIALPEPSTVITAKVVNLAQPGNVKAFNADGSIAGSRNMAAWSGKPESIQISGQAITRIIITVPGDETLLLSLCYTSGEAIRSEDDSGDVSRFPQPAFSLHRRRPGATSGGATQIADCIRYEIDLRATHEYVRVQAGVTAALTIALRERKAVDAQTLAAAPPQDVTFQNRSVDHVFMYTAQAATSLMICVDVLLDATQEENEWASVPYLKKGIQMPAQSVNAALTSTSDEKALATSRLLSGESFDPSVFESVAEAMNDAGAGNTVASPMWYTMVTCERTEDPFIEIRPWPYALSLIVDATWRRMLGFGYFDDGRSLSSGASYDYRITGYFRRRDIEERLFGFHTVPSGTTLPQTFQLGPLLFHTFYSSIVEIFPAVPAGVLQATGRKGIYLKESGTESLTITFPTPVRSVVLEFESAATHNLTYQAKTSDYTFGLSGTVSDGIVPAQNRVELVFNEPIDTLNFRGSALFYGVRIVDSPAGSDPDEVVQRSVNIYDVVYQSSPAPASPPFLGTMNLQEPVIAGDPAITTQNPPRSLGFKLSWLPPLPAGLASPVPWPSDLGAFPPFDALGFNIERRRVDTGGPFVEIDGRVPPTLFFGDRGGRRSPEQLNNGIDILQVYPEGVKIEPPISVFMEQQDVLVSAAKPGPPLGSFHQYRIFTVDAIGRRSASATIGSIVRLEKRIPPPQPVGPVTAAPERTTLPSGVRARVLQASDPELSAADRALLGASTNAIVLEWGWTAKQREYDPYVRNFRIYYQPVPPDIVHGTLTGAATFAPGLWSMSAMLDQSVATDIMKGRYIRCGDYPFKVASNDAGAAISIRFEPSVLEPNATPLASAFEFRPILDGSELRPGAWPERAAIVPLTGDEEYSFGLLPSSGAVFRDRLVLDADHPLARVWVGVSAADDQSYIADEIPATRSNGGQPGNESSIASAAAQARYFGRPVFTVPLPLPDVPEQVSDEPAGDAVAVSLNLSALVPSAVIPGGHKVNLYRMPMDELSSCISARDDDRIGVTFPDGTTTNYSLANAADQATFLEQLRSGAPGRIEGRFLMDLLLQPTFSAKFETLWHPALQTPITFGTFIDILPSKAERYVHRFKLVDQAGHVSAGSAIVPQIVRVASLRSPAPPSFEMPNSNTGSVAITARVRDIYDIKWLVLFTITTNVENSPDSRTIQKAQLLRLPNRRDLYPNDGIRLRLADGTLLSPAATDVATGTRSVPDRVLNINLNPGFEKRVAVWAVTLTRDGIPSRFAGPLIAITGPRPLVVPSLTVTMAAAEDVATWNALTVPSEVTVERSTDAGATWTRVSPWLPDTISPRSFTIPAVTSARLYRLVLRGSRDRRAVGAGVAPI